MVLQNSLVDDIQALTFNRLTINANHANLSSYKVWFNFSVQHCSLPTHQQWAGGDSKPD